LLPPGGKFVCQVQQEVSQPELDAADVNAAYTVSVGVSGVASPLGSNSSEVTSGDVEAVALAPAVVRGMSISSTSTSPTTVKTAGEPGIAHITVHWCVKCFCFGVLGGKYCNSHHLWNHPLMSSMSGASEE
jgi:hypothetical protein